MEIKLSFIKACALGNDFVLIEEPSVQGVNFRKLSLFLSKRRYGVGCDQVIYYQTTAKKNIFSVRFFNSDGSEAESCGNGSRCIANYLMQKYKIQELVLETLGGILYCERIQENLISIITQVIGWQEVVLNDYSTLSKPQPIFVNMGNPHLICFTEQPNLIGEYGPVLEKYLSQINPSFPKCVNVEFVKIISPNLLSLRVWERGAGLTPACGTGACAAAVAAYERGLIKNSVSVEQEGGKLSILINNKELKVEGEAYTTFEGNLTILKNDFL